MFDIVNVYMDDNHLENMHFQCQKETKATGKRDARGQKMKSKKKARAFRRATSNKLDNSDGFFAPCRG